MFKINTGVSALKFNVLSEHAQRVMFHVRHCLYAQIFSPSDLDSEEGITRVLHTLDSLENVAAGKFLFIFCCKMS